MKKNSVKNLTFSAILIALGILIPLVMPVKVAIGPASFTLASHVPVMLAMFLSPGVAVAVALGTAFGFFITFPPVVAFRAMSHLVFAIVGALFLQKRPQIVQSPKQMLLFNAGVGLVHAFFEVLVVTVFFTQGNMGGIAYGYAYTVLLLVGLGGFIHSLIDFTLAFYIGKELSKHFSLPVFQASNQGKNQPLSV